jgi:hypothetical protein
MDVAVEKDAQMVTSMAHRRSSGTPAQRGSRHQEIKQISDKKARPGHTG